MGSKRAGLSTPFYLFLINGIALCCGFLIFILISLHALEQTAISQTEQNLRTFAYSIKQLLQNQQNLTLDIQPGNGLVSIDQFVKNTASHDPGFRISIIDGEGVVVGDSDANLEQLENHLNRHEVVEALAGREAADIRSSSIYNEMQVYYAIPFSFQGRSMALRLSIPIGRNVFFASNVRQNSIVSMVVILAAILLVSFAIAAKILRPLNELKKTARFYEEGHFDYRPVVSSPKEFAELAENISSMGQTIQQNIADISRSRDDLRRLERVRKDFVANVSHELKTPVTAISGFIETLQDGAIDDQATARHFLDIMAQQSSRLSNIIDDLLTLSQLEQTRATIETQPVNLLDIITDVLASHSYLAQANNISISYEFSPKDAVIHLSANPGLISQALGNIVNNSVKYCPSGSEVHITARRLQDQDGNPWVKIVVEDTGNGIPVEYQKRIFERFFRVDKGRSRATGGTGLGLSIVHHIIQLHGGSIRSCNRRDGRSGARFEMELPGV